jgi:hypothetical protein
MTEQAVLDLVPFAGTGRKVKVKDKKKVKDIKVKDMQLAVQPSGELAESEGHAACCAAFGRTCRAD